MRDLDEFLYKFREDKKAIPHSITNTIKQFSPKSKESRNLVMKINTIKKAIIIATSLLLGSGVVLAATKTYENIWKQPETYDFSFAVTENERKEAISENEARNKAVNYLMKIGLDKEVTQLGLEKDFYDNEVVWNIGFESGVITLDSKGNFRSLNIPSFTYTIPYDYGITREEARKVAKELLLKYNPEDNSDEYELVSLKRNSEEDKGAYIWYADFYKKYDGLLNSYEKICIGWIPKINGLYSLSFENNQYENNELIIPKEDAIKIATEKDKQIETRHNIVSIDADIGIDKMNTEVVYREKNIEEYEKGTINFIPNENGNTLVKKGDAIFYKVENRVRKVWEVTICYDYYRYDKDFPERFVYYVDATTGEIIGGDRFFGAKMQTKNLMEDPYNVIEK